MKKVVLAFGEEYTCQSFFCSDRNISGVDVYRGCEWVGEIVNLDIPDENDIDEIAKFKTNVIEWLAAGES